MRQQEQKHKAFEWLSEQAKNGKSMPFRRFTPKEVAYATGGTHTTIGGLVAEEIVVELNAHGIYARYISSGNKRFFELF